MGVRCGAGVYVQVIPVLQDSLLLSGTSLEAQIRYGYLAQQEAIGGLSLTLLLYEFCVSFSVKGSLQFNQFK